MVQSFRDLQVWQRAVQLSIAIYRLTKEFPREEIYGLSSQIRRSAVSVPSNIAEGQGRLWTGEFKQFLGIARGLTSRCKRSSRSHAHWNFGTPGCLMRPRDFRTKLER